MDAAAFEQKIWEIKREMDEQGLSELMKRLTPDEFQQYRPAMAVAWHYIYDVRFYDYTWSIWHNVTASEKAKFLLSLLDILATAEGLDPSVMYYSDKAQCYAALANEKDKREEKLFYIEKAIAQIKDGIQAKPDVWELYHILVDILQNKIVFNNQFLQAEFTELLLYFDKTLSLYPEKFLTRLVYSCYWFLRYPFLENEHWHHVFLEKLAAKLYKAAETDPLIYKEWSVALQRISRNYYVSPSFPPACVQQVILERVRLMKLLLDPETNLWSLGDIGYEFADIACTCYENNYITEALEIYEAGLKYLTKYR